MVDINSTFDEKKKFLIDSIKNKNTDEKSLINILNLIGATNLNDSVFTNKLNIFKDLEEYSDIKTAIKKELIELKMELALAYLSTVSSCGNNRVCDPSKIKKLDKFYKLLMVNLGIFILGHILAVYLDKINIEDRYIVDDAILLMRQISSPLGVLDMTLAEVFDFK